MSTPTAYYASTYVNLLFDYLQDQGLDAVHVLGESSPNCQEVRLYALDHWRRLLERAAEVCNDPLLGLHVGQRIAPAHLGVLGYALGACPDVGAVLQRWQQYDRVVANVTPAELRTEGKSVVMTWPRSTEPTGPLVDETALAAMTRFTRAMTDGDVRLEEVCFVNATPQDTTPYLAYFGCPVKFDQPETSLRFPVDLLQAPLRQPDEALLRIMELQVQALLGAMPKMDDMEHAIRQAVAGLARQGEVSLETVASSMHMTPRTLQRRLDKLGLKFRELRDDTRRRIAENYLKDPRLSLAEVAWILGYSEHSAFTRAFRRWTSQSPQAWRREMDA